VITSKLANRCYASDFKWPDFLLITKLPEKKSGEAISNPIS